MMFSRKLFAIAAVVTALSPISKAYAGCTIKCVTRDPFSGRCIVKTKVCDIGTPREILQQAEKDVKRFAQNIQREWHKAYGNVPEWARNILNTYPVTILGAALGGYSAAALGMAIDELILKSVARMERMDDYADGESAWKRNILEKGFQIVTGEELQTIGEGCESNQYMRDDIDPLYNEFLRCAKAAQAPDPAWTCLDTFEDSLYKIRQKARRCS